MRVPLSRRTSPLPPRLNLLLALVLFDLFLVCAAEHVGIGRPVADTSQSACLTVPEDGTHRLLDTLRQPEWLAVEPDTLHPELNSPNIVETASRDALLWTPVGPHRFSRPPLHLRLCVWLV